MTNKFGPRHAEVESLIARIRTMSAEEMSRAGAAWAAATGVARGAARVAAWSAATRVARDVARGAAWAAAWDAVQYPAKDATWNENDAVRDAACDAAIAEVVRDIIKDEQYRLLADPINKAIGGLKEKDA